MPFPFPEDFLYPGVEFASPALAGGFFTTEPTGTPHHKQQGQTNTTVSLLLCFKEKIALTYSGVFFFLINSYWSIAALKFCVSFLMYSKVNQSYVYIRIHIYPYPLLFRFPFHL